MRRISTIVAVALAVACTEAGPAAPDAPAASLAKSASAAAFPEEVTLSFGRDDVGSPYAPPEEHDQSFHAKDKIRPRLVHLAAGGNVVFDMGTFHGVAIYEPGTKPEDIEVSDATLEDLTIPFPPFVLPDFLIDDPDGRVTAPSPISFGPMQWSPPEGTFDEPGRYLVICYVVPHFVFAKMYAYIEVR
jgi:hypothetical protein